MRASIIIRAPRSFSPRSYPRVQFAGFGSRRSQAALVIVLLLSALFAAAILAALQPRPLADAIQASVEGGL